MQTKNTLPIYIAFAIVIGFFLGSKINSKQSTNTFAAHGSKLHKLVKAIENDYVDHINVDSIVELSMGEILDKLDPHSNYFPAEDMKSVTENMQGNFEGVGIEFQLFRDSLVVINTIDNGPSKKAGILKGDRITWVDTFQVSGRKITNKQIIDNLRGPSGSKITIHVQRGDDSLAYDVYRGKIPIKSVDIAYLIKENIGYLKLNRFSATTIDEVSEHLNRLRKEGAQKLIIDLRGNPGGYLHAAVALSEYFLDKSELIVYTKGRNRPTEKYFAERFGRFSNKPLVILIDEGSASASEIVAGAIQDNDKGIIVGRRSFGKGLVQEEYKYGDGTASRITTARYYTPSGRSIQRSYANGDKAYYAEIVDLQNTDSKIDSNQSIPDSLTFKTKNGRIVYGGGGIYPDIYIHSDTNLYRYQLNLLFSHRILRTVAFEYVDANRTFLDKMGLTPFVNSFQIDEYLWQKVVNTAIEKEVITKDFKFNKKEKDFLFEQLKISIGSRNWSNSGLFRTQNSTDSDVIKALEILENETS